MMVHGAHINAAAPLQRGYGATAARLTPDQKVGSSNLSALTFHCPCCHVQGLLAFLAWGTSKKEMASSAPRDLASLRASCPTSPLRALVKSLASLNSTGPTPSPHRLVVRTSRCGRDNPGSTPGVDIFHSDSYGAMTRMQIIAGLALSARKLPLAQLKSLRSIHDTHNCGSLKIAPQDVGCRCAKGSARRKVPRPGIEPGTFRSSV